MAAVLRFGVGRILRPGAAVQGGQARVAPDERNQDE